MCHVTESCDRATTVIPCTLCSSVVGRGDAFEPLLSGRVPSGTEGGNRYRGHRRRRGVQGLWLIQIYLVTFPCATSICLQYGVAYQSVCEVDSDHRRSSYSHLQTEGNAQHLKALHLKVHSDRGFVVLLKRLLAEP